MMVYSTFLTKEDCEAAFDLITNKDFGETGEVWIEDNWLQVEVYPVGVASAPERLENETVRIDLVERDCGLGGGSCFVCYSVAVKQ